MRISNLLLISVLLMASSASGLSDPPDVPSGLSFSNIGYMDAAMWRAKTVADHRIRYGNDLSPVQFADLRIPEGDAPGAGFPVIVFIHGGAWRAQWSKDYTEALVEQLAASGFATWDLEFRRMGHQGGGYPGTFEDVADGLDHLRVVAQDYPLDLSRVIVIGHSSGGHLALWLIGRHHLDESSPLHREEPLPVAGVISIAGVNDLELSLTLGNRTDVLDLAGVESLQTGRDRLAEIDPGKLLPLGVPQILFIGDGDAEWRLDMTERYQANAREAGDDVRTVLLPGANHMDVVDAKSGVAALLAEAARELIDG